VDENKEIPDRNTGVPLVDKYGNYRTLIKVEVSAMLKLITRTETFLKV
jgi:hypothetical protein